MSFAQAMTERDALVEAARHAPVGAFNHIVSVYLDKAEMVDDFICRIFSSSELRPLGKACGV